jgi:hypothetical protein
LGVFFLLRGKYSLYSLVFLLASQRSLTQKGSRKEWTRQDIRKDALTQEGNDKTHIERASRLMTNWQNFIFLSKLYTRGRGLNITTLWPSYNLSVFATLHSYCQCPWLSISFFSVKGNHLAFLPTVIETWCTCRFQPCRNAAKPQRPCQTVAFGSQHFFVVCLFILESESWYIAEISWNSLYNPS